MTAKLAKFAKDYIQCIGGVCTQHNDLSLFQRNKHANSILLDVCLDSRYIVIVCKADINLMAVQKEYIKKVTHAGGIIIFAKSEDDILDAIEYIRKVDNETKSEKSQ